LSDKAAAKVACALGIHRFLSSKRYKVQRQCSIRSVLAGIIPCVVRNVGFDGRHDQAVWLSWVPSTVTSMAMQHCLQQSIEDQSLFSSTDHD